MSPLMSPVLPNLHESLLSVSILVQNEHRSNQLTSPEFWFMGYIIYLRMGASPIVALARQIGQLRKETRAKFRDIYSNTPTVTFMYRWLDKLAIERPGPNQQVAAIEWEHEGVPTSMGMAKKRKMDQRQEDEDPDYRGGSSSRNGARAAPAARARKAAAPTSTANRPAAPPPPPAVRPPSSAMDAAPGAYPYPGQPAGVSPYAVNNPYDQRAQQVSTL